ncbi:MAG: HEAT repeat domain-containing protein [Planctomycetota bacterium]
MDFFFVEFLLELQHKYMETKDLADNTIWKQIKKEYKTQGSNYSKLQEKLLEFSRTFSESGEIIWSRLEEICTPEHYLDLLKHELWAGNKHIRELFEPTSFYVRQDLARRLKEVADCRITSALLTLLKTEEDWFVKTQILNLLGHLKDIRSLEHLIAFLNDDSWQVSYEAACAIAKIGKPESLPLLLSYLDKQDTIRGQAKALKLLGYLNRKEVLPLYKEALKSEEPEIQLGALEGLFHLKSPETLILLKEFLGKAKKEIRGKIVEILSSYPSQDSLPILIACLKDPSFLVRRAACFGLANLRDEEALVPLSELLMDTYCITGKYPVREAAKMAIKKFKGGKEFLVALESEVVVPPKTLSPTLFASNKIDLIEPETLMDEDGVTQPRLGALKSKILATYRNPANIVNPGMDEMSDSGIKKVEPASPLAQTHGKKTKSLRIGKIINRTEEEGIQKTTKSKGVSQVIGLQEQSPLPEEESLDSIEEIEDAENSDSKKQSMNPKTKGLLRSKFSRKRR